MIQMITCNIQLIKMDNTHLLHQNSKNKQKHRYLLPSPNSKILDYWYIKLWEKMVSSQTLLKDKWFDVNNLIIYDNSMH